MAAGGYTGVQEFCNTPLGGSDCDDDLVNIVLFYCVLHLIRPADNRYAGDGRVLAPGVVVQDRYRGSISVTPVLNIPDDRRAGVAGADHEDPFFFFTLFMRSGIPVTDQETGSGNEGQRDHPLDEIDRTGHEDQSGTDLVLISAAEQGNDEGNEIGDTGTDQRSHDRLEKDIHSGIAQQAPVNPGDPQRRQGRDQQQRQGPQHLGHPDSRNAEGEIEFNRNEQTRRDKQCIQEDPPDLLSFCHL